MAWRLDRHCPLLGQKGPAQHRKDASGALWTGSADPCDDSRGSRMDIHA